MQSLIKRIAATAGAVGFAAWAAGVPNIPALASSHSSGNELNPYAPSYGHPYRRGAVPTQAQYARMRSWAASHNSTRSTGSETLQYGGGIDGIGVTSGTPRVYLVFWGSQWGTQGTDTNGNLTFSNDPDHAAPYLQNLFKGLGTGGELWSGTMTQYCDGSGVAVGATSCSSSTAHVGYPTGGALAGVWYDNSTAEPQTASGNQIGSEALAASAHFGNTTAASNRYVQYDIVSSTGLNPDNWLGQGFCAWHDYNGDTTLSGGAISSSYDFSFTNMPYVGDLGASCGAGFVNSGNNLDGFSIVNGHEYAETVTDQNPAGGWTNQQVSSRDYGYENGDECAWISPSSAGGAADVSTGSGSFAMQSTWSNDTNNCAISHPIVTGGTTSNDFSISDSPSSGSVTAGSGTTTTVSTAVTSGSAQTVSLSASGLPSGASASFNPSSVTAGSSSTLSIATSSTTPTGTYSITVTGTGPSATHSASYSLTVTSSGGSGGNAIANGGFETGTFSGWSTSGAFTGIATSPVHTGSYSGLEGYYSPTGVSSITQTFTAASGDSQLTFWYYTVCGGSPKYNYATVTLRDNTASRTTTPLAKTCATTGGWRQVTVTITAGHVYTLTLQNRDNRTAQTYAAYDDIATS